MITQFSPTTIEAIGSYVYALTDDCGKIFYIGKGEGNRVFDHINSARQLMAGKNVPILKEQEDDAAYSGEMSLKLQVISDILATQKIPGMYVIREGLSSEQALLVEAALISVLNWQFDDALSNIVSGHGTNHFGLKTVQELEATKGRAFCISDLPCLDNCNEVIAINVNKRWSEAKCNIENILQISKGTWKLNVERAKRCPYAIIHANGIVRAVFEIASWKEANVKGRYEFVPKCTTPLKGPQFSNLNASSLFGISGSGSQNPIRYVSIKTAS